MIIYLHGFRSSPASFKTQLLAEKMRALGYPDTDYVCPHLPASPKDAIDLVQNLMADAAHHGAAQDVCLIGSSLGGFYATWLAEQNACRAVLLNPAVKPPQDLAKYVGVSTEYHSERAFEFKHEYIAQLQALAVPHITHPERYFLLAATGDEVLNWQDMVAHYPGAQHRIINGSDHGISEFAQYRDEVLAFCGVNS